MNFVRIVFFVVFIIIPCLVEGGSNIIGQVKLERTFSEFDIGNVKPDPIGIDIISNEIHQIYLMFKKSVPELFSDLIKFSCMERCITVTTSKILTNQNSDESADDIKGGMDDNSNKKFTHIISTIVSNLFFMIFGITFGYTVADL